MAVHVFIPGVGFALEMVQGGDSAVCLVPAFDGAFLARDWKEALWGKFYTGAPLRQRQSVERYNIVKRA